MITFFIDFLINPTLMKRFIVAKGRGLFAKQKNAITMISVPLCKYLTHLTVVASVAQFLEHLS